MKKLLPFTAFLLLLLAALMIVRGYRQGGASGSVQGDTARLEMRGEAGEGTSRPDGSPASRTKRQRLTLEDSLGPDAEIVRLPEGRGIRIGFPNGILITAARATPTPEGVNFRGPYQMGKGNEFSMTGSAESSVFIGRNGTMKSSGKATISSGPPTANPAELPTESNSLLEEWNNSAR